jgi:hypothetical protein
VRSPTDVVGPPSRRNGGRSRASAAALAPLLLWAGGALFVGAYMTWDPAGSFGYDSHAYWLAWRGGLSSSRPPGAQDAYLYSPLFAQLIWPLTLLPARAFEAVWSLGLAVVFAWLLRPTPWRWRLPLYLLCVPEILAGNLFGLFAAVLVLGTRWPGLWAVPAVTKIVPGGVGLLDLLLRRQWRSAGIAAAVSAAGCLASFAASPHLWVAWVHFLTTTVDPAGWRSRPAPAVAAGAALVAVVALARRHRTLLPVAMLLASPVIGPNTLTMLAAIPRLHGDGAPVPGAGRGTAVEAPQASGP